MAGVVAHRAAPRHSRLLAALDFRDRALQRVEPIENDRVGVDFGGAGRARNAVARRFGVVQAGVVVRTAQAEAHLAQAVRNRGEARRSTLNNI